MDIPVLGRIFRTESDQVDRTELIILITPHVIRDRKEAQSVTAEFEDRIRGLKGMLNRVQKPPVRLQVDESARSTPGSRPLPSLPEEKENMR